MLSLLFFESICMFWNNKFFKNLIDTSWKKSFVEITDSISLIILALIRPYIFYNQCFSRKISILSTVKFISIKLFIMFFSLFNLLYLCVNLFISNIIYFCSLPLFFYLNIIILVFGPTWTYFCSMFLPLTFWISFVVFF